MTWILPVWCLLRLSSFLSVKTNKQTNIETRYTPSCHYGLLISLCQNKQTNKHRDTLRTPSGHYGLSSSLSVKTNKQTNKQTNIETRYAHHHVITASSSLSVKTNKQTNIETRYTHHHVITVFLISLSKQTNKQTNIETRYAHHHVITASSSLSVKTNKTTNIHTNIETRYAHHQDFKQETHRASRLGSGLVGNPETTSNWSLGDQLRHMSLRMIHSPLTPTGDQGGRISRNMVFYFTPPPPPPPTPPPPPQSELDHGASEKNLCQKYAYLGKIKCLGNICV